MIAFKLAFKELINHRRLSFFFIVNLTIGLLSFILLDSFKLSVENHLNQNSRAMMGADLVVSSSESISQDDLSFIESHLKQGFERTDSLSFFSMVAKREATSVFASKFSEILAIEGAFPYYGELALEDFKGGPVAVEEARLELRESKVAWVYPLVAAALKLKQGDTILVGRAAFEVKYLVLKDPGRQFTAIGFAPRVYISKRYFPQTKLKKKGSRIRHLHFYKLTNPLGSQRLAETMRAELEKRHQAVSLINIFSHRDSGEQMGRLLMYIGDYLGLVSVVALFLSGIGAAYLFRTFLSSKLNQMAILISLGARRRLCYGVAVMQIFILGLAGVVFAVGLAMLAKPLLPQLLAKFLPEGFVSLLSIKSLYLSAFVATFGSLFFCFPFLSVIRRISPLVLLQENTRQEGLPTPSLSMGIRFLPALISLYGMSVWITHSWRVGSLFFGLFFASFLLIMLVGYVLFFMILEALALKNPVRQMALRNLKRNKAAGISAFLALSIGSLLLSLIPLIHTALARELDDSQDGIQPAFFLVGIQEEQIEELKAFGEKNSAPIENLSPMVRGRAKKLNGEPIFFKKEKNLTREEQTREFFKSRTVNMTYRSGINASEKIIEGEPIQGIYDWNSGQPAQVSMEFRYANRMGYQIGDIVEYEVQGLPVEAKIINIRKVKWTSFRPNFFISFQPGVLEDAPKIFLASVSAVLKTGKEAFQNKLVELFPNISLIDLQSVIEEMKKIINQMAFAIKIMALFCVVAGFMVIFSIASYEMSERRREINLLKVLGGEFSVITRMVLWEFGCIGTAAAVCGTSMSLGLSFIFARLFFDNQWAFDPSILLQSIPSILGLCLGISFIAAFGVLRQKPLELLKAS